MDIYTIYFKTGLHSPIKIAAKTEEEARVAATAAFRKDQYFVDFRSPDQIITAVKREPANG